MRRFAVLGNCQAGSITSAIKHYCPDAVIETFPFFRLRSQSDQEKAETVAHLATFDIVFTQPVAQARVGGIETQYLRGHAQRVVEYPAITFTGFHPDFGLIYVGGKELLSPAGPHHSLIAVACYILGFSVQRTVAVYNAYFFSLLGYIEAYDRAAKFLIAKSAQSGVDISALFARWESSGVFMYTPNHPKPNVLYSLAKLVLDLNGIAHTEDATPEIQYRDHLAHLGKLPFYPLLADRRQMDGSYKFNVPKRMVQPDAPGVLELFDFVTRSFAIYEQYTNEQLKTKEVSEVLNIVREVGVR